MLVHAIVPGSRVNGPGLRAVLWLQGCLLHCPGCWNMATHRFDLSRNQSVTEIVARSLACHEIEGVTFSGGEPMQQAGDLLALIQQVRQKMPELSFGMFSGYTEGELDQGRYFIWRSELEREERKALWHAIRSFMDFAVLGRFNRLEPCAQPLRTSRNQVLRLFSRRYQESDFAEQAIEIQIDDVGRAEITGFPVLGLPS